MTARFLKDLAILFATVDPVGAVLVFIALTHDLTAKERNRIAARSVMIAAAMLFGFMIAGQLLLGAMHVGMESFQIAGAIFLFFFGAQLTFANNPHGPVSPEEGHDIAVYPMALPAIASPGALAAVVILTDNERYSIPMQAMTAVALLLVLTVTYVLLRAATPVNKVLGRAGAQVMTRVLGLILASLAVELLLQAVQMVRG